MQIVHIIAGVVITALYLFMMQEKNASRIRQLRNGGWIPFWAASIVMPLLAYGQFVSAFR